MRKAILLVMLAGLLAPLGVEAGALRFAGKAAAKVLKTGAKATKAVAKSAAKVIY